MVRVKRAGAMLVALLMIFVMVLAPVGYAVAAEIVLIGVAAPLVVTAILVACGLEMTNPGTLARLSDEIIAALQWASEIPMRLMSGTLYLEASLIDLVTRKAAELGAFAPVEQSVATIDGVAYPYFETREKYGELLDLNVSQFPVLRSFSMSQVLSGYSETFGCGSDLSINISPGSGGYYSRSLYKSGALVSGGSGYLEPSGSLYFSSAVCFKIMSLYYLMPVYWTTGREHPMVIVPPISGSPVCISNPSISAEFPWDVGEHVPSISADGAIDYPLTWGNGAVALPGVDAPSLPLTIPDSIPAFKDIPQDKAQEGTPSKAITDSAAAAEDDKIFEDNKDKFSIPAELTERFPFSIPWDIVRGIELLNAPPVPPAFEIPFKFEYENIHFDRSITLDFEMFSTQMAVIRWGEMLVFIIALAMATRKIIWK